MPHGPVRRRHPARIVARPSHAGFRPLLLGGEAVPSESAGALGGIPRTGLDWADSRDGEQAQYPDIGPGAVDGRVHIAPASLVSSLFASSILPPEVVTSLPALPDATYPQGRLVFLTTDQKLYRNTDGSTWSTAVDGADVIANSITAGQISAGAIGADELAASLVLASVIKTSDTGQRLELDVNGLRSYNSLDEVEVQIPTDGSAVYVKGAIQATELLVTGNASLRGPGNSMGLSSVMSLESLQQPPGSAPVLTQGWDFVGMPFDATYDFDATHMYRYGLHYSTAGGAGGATNVLWTISFDSTGQRWLLELKASDRTVNRAMLLDADPQYQFYSPVQFGATVYWLRAFQLDFVTTWDVQSVPVATLSGITTYGSVNFPITPRHPVLAASSADIYIVDKATGTASIKWNRYNSSMVKQGSTIDTTYDSGTNDYFVAGAAGNFDFGAFRLAVCSVAQNTVQLFDSTGARQANESFPLKASPANGLAYGDVLGDGARFFSHATNGVAAQLTKHTTWTWTTASAKYWVAYSWYDSVGTTHETTVGPQASITMGRRKKLIVSTAALPGAGGADEPDNRRIYIFPNATQPATTSLDLQATSASTSVSLTTYNAAGAAPPVANDFPAGTAAEVKSAVAGWSLKGDGTASFVDMAVSGIITLDADVTIERTAADELTIAGGTINLKVPSITINQTGGNQGLGMADNYILFAEIGGGTEPTNPTAGRVKLYARQNGGGKTELRARFDSGAFVTIVTEP